jgi:hypothetical protein
VLQKQTWREFFDEAAEGGFVRPTEKKKYERYKELSMSGDPGSMNMSAFDKSKGAADGPSSRFNSRLSPIRGSNSPSFEKGAQQPTHSRGRARSTSGSSNGSVGSTGLAGAQFSHVPEMKNLLALAFDRMCKRVELQWEELKMCEADRKFYRKTLLRPPPASLEQCRDVARYVRTLKAHRVSTLAVLQAIRRREVAISSVLELLVDINKFVDQSLQGKMAGDRAESHEALYVWRPMLMRALEAAQSMTVEVIRAIQKWRQELWRPLPFIWNGINYLFKCRLDLAVLFEKKFSGLLKLLDVHPRSQILCCLVPMALDAPEIFETSGQRFQRGIENDIDAIFTGEANRHTQQGGEQPDTYNYPDGPTLIREVTQAAKVLAEEETVQRALEVEKKALYASSSFIPTLKVPGD